MLAVLAPRYWGAHLLALVLVAAAGGLGWWQYDAYQARRAAEAVDLTRAEPVPLAELMGADEAFPGDRVGQPVLLGGTWIPSGTVFVEGREHEGRDGYWMVTPLAIGGATQPAMPVVLGWTPSPARAPAPPTGTGEVTGWLQPTDGTGQSDTDRTDDVIPQVRTADLIQHVDQDLYGAYTVLDPQRSDPQRSDDQRSDPQRSDDQRSDDQRSGTAASGDLVAADLEELPPPAGGTGLRNLLYALEWLVFGGFAGFVWWRYVREVTHSRSSHDAAAPPPPGPPVPSGA